MWPYIVNAEHAENQYSGCQALKNLYQQGQQRNRWIPNIGGRRTAPIFTVMLCAAYPPNGGF
jgi:hypothetical protein